MENRKIKISTQANYALELKNVQEIEQIALMISHIDRYKSLDGKGLELDEILSICAVVLEVPEETIKQKIQHSRYKILRKQLIFLWAAGYYSNHSCKQIAQFMPCHPNTIIRAIDSMKSVITRIGEEYPVLLNIIAACEKRCPGRIKNNFKLGLEHGEMDVTDGSDTWSLNLYQINTIPVKEISWFINGRGMFKDLFGVIAYKLGEHTCKSITMHTVSEREHLFMLQSFGYRFIERNHKNYSLHKERNPICDKCAKKVGCPFRGRGHESLFSGRDKFSCFTALDKIEMKIDIKLLYPLEKYRLQ